MPTKSLFPILIWDHLEEKSHCSHKQNPLSLSLSLARDVTPGLAPLHLLQHPAPSPGSCCRSPAPSPCIPANLCQRSPRLWFEAKHLGDHFHSQSVSPSFGISCGPLVNCSQLRASRDGKQATADTWLQALECSFTISPAETEFVEFKSQLFA